MVRRWTLLWGVLAGLIPASTFSLGLGDIVVRSDLNQPLSAEIPLLSARPDDVENATVRIASNEDFKRQGLDRPAFLTQLHFEALRKRDGTPYIKITSTQPIREPFVDFLLDIDWVKGRLQRRYTLLLDPPGHKVRTEIALAPRPRSQAQPAESPVYEGPVSTSVVQRGKDSYGPSGRRDTLWSIAMRLRPDSSVSVYQTMLALLRANPQAFVDKDNINSLKAGEVLRVPSVEEMAAVSHEDAFQDVRRQNRAWRESGRRIAQASAGRLASSEKSGDKLVPKGPSKAPSQAPGKAPAEAASEQMRLKLVSPSAGQPGVAGQAMPGQAPAPTEQDLSALREELAVTSQELGSKRQENEQLRARVAQLESMVGSMERMITLKGDELAQLQDRLNALDKAQPAAQTAPTPQSPAQSATQSPGEVSASAPSSAAPVTRSVKEKTGPAHAAVRLESESLLDSVLSNPLLLGTGVAAVLSLLTALWWLARKARRRDMATHMPSFEPSFEQEGFTEDQRAAPTQVTKGVQRSVAAAQRSVQEGLPSGSMPAAAATAGATAARVEPAEPQSEVPLFADLPADLGDDLLGDKTLGDNLFGDNRDFAGRPSLDDLDVAPSVAGAPASPNLEERAAQADSPITDELNLRTEDETAKLRQTGRLETLLSLGSESAPPSAAEDQTAKLPQSEHLGMDIPVSSKSAQAQTAEQSAIFEWEWPEPAGGPAAPETASANDAGDLSDFTVSLGPEQQPEAMAGLWNEPSEPAAQNAAVPSALSSGRWPRKRLLKARLPRRPSSIWPRSTSIWACSRMRAPCFRK